MKLSVITVNYNNKYGLEKTIKSVISQSFKDYEYIIIDGGSTDGSCDIINQYAPNIHYWISEKDKGVYNAMNKAISIARGEYLNFLNSGDYYYNEHVLKELFSHNYNAQIIIGRSFMSDFKSRSLIYIPPARITLLTLFNKSINHQAAFINNDLMKKYGYDEKYQIVADFKFFLEAFIIEQCGYQRYDEIVVTYDLSGISSRENSKLYHEKKKALKDVLPSNIYEDYELMAELEFLNDLAPSLISLKLKRIVHKITKLTIYFYKIFTIITHKKGI